MYESSPLRALLDPEIRQRERDRQNDEDNRRQQEEINFAIVVKHRFLTFEGATESRWVREKDALIAARKRVDPATLLHDADARQRERDRQEIVERRRQQDDADLEMTARASYLMRGGTNAGWLRERDAILAEARRCRAERSQL